jgi:hypothetical protein
MMLIIQTKDGSDEAFLSFSADEIYAMVYAEEHQRQCLSTQYVFIIVLSSDTAAEHVFDSVKEDNPMAVKMIFRIGTLA